MIMNKDIQLHRDVNVRINERLRQWMKDSYQLGDIAVIDDAVMTLLIVHSLCAALHAIIREERIPQQVVKGILKTEGVIRVKTTS